MSDTKTLHIFDGFSDLYDDARPILPKELLRILFSYLDERPHTIIDLGSGTGLSSRVLSNFSDRVIGIEPNDDMRREAEKEKSEKLTFIKATAEATGLPSDFCDAIICSQSFHWMEPQAALKEAGRILKPFGLFAAIDYEWPPILNYEMERAYYTLHSKIKKLAKEHLGENAPLNSQRPKNKHLSQMNDSGVFAYTREIAYLSTESFTADRLKRLLLSISSTQFVLRHLPHLIADDLTAFFTFVDQTYGDESFDVSFSYHVRLGIKDERQ